MPLRLPWYKAETKPAPVVTNAEILADMIALQEEWRSFLEQQARITRRAAKRLRDDASQPEAPEVTPVNEKAALRSLAVSRGMFNRGGRA